MLFRRKRAQTPARQAPVMGQEVLEKLASLPISTWNYKGESAQVLHLGPTAQDFAAAFGLGVNDRRISVVDANGIVMVSIQALYRRLEALQADLANLRFSSVAAEDRFAVLERLANIRATMAWVAQARLSDSPLISVVLPTRNRSALLPRAVASVLAQDYAHWELLIVDDGSDDDTPSVIDSFTDPRIHSFRTNHRGVCGARNAGLRHVSGEIVAYLDDDNTMHPGWLKAVVWAFEQRPEVDALYGAFVVDDWERVNGKGSGSLPTVFLRPYDRQSLLRGNLADIGAVAHRAGLAEAIFDEDLREMGDWDLLLRITAHRDPLVLPAIACFYSTDAPNRLSGGESHLADSERVQTKNSHGTSAQ